jgi:hypothetical protein
MFPVALALLACHQQYDHLQELSADEPLPALGTDCAPDSEDTEREDGTRVVSWVEPTEEGCRAALYARLVAADWAEVDRAIDEAIPTKTNVSWPDAGVELGRLWVEATGGVAPPVGTRVRVEQMLSTAHRDQAALDEDPAALLGALESGELADWAEHLLGFDYELVGDESGSLDAPVLPPNVAGVVDLINESYAHDPEMYVVTVASVVVPMEELERIGGTELAVQLEETMSITASISLDWF